jgi:hypothetical protein
VKRLEKPRETIFGKIESFSSSRRAKTLLNAIFENALCNSAAGLGRKVLVMGGDTATKKTLVHVVTYLWISEEPL